MAEPPTPTHGPLAVALDLPRAPSRAEYTDLFVFQLYPYGSVYLGPEGMLGGAARDRVAGFWRALGRTPPGEPDHLSALLGLYASLSGEERAGHVSAERVLTGAGRDALLHEHLAPWVFPFLDRVSELAGAFYARWAALLADVLLDEVRRHPPPDGLPAHHRACGPVPDPRAEGAAAFVGGLLAPARSGLILARADLARIAAATGLGLRAGERRYALEHLLAQAPAPVLEALAAEADRQGGRHAERARDPGAAAHHLAVRAGATARLLRALATEMDPAGV